MGRGSSLDAIAKDLASGEISRRAALKRLAAASIGLGAATAPGVAHALGGGCPGDRVKCGNKCCPANARCKQGKCKCKSGFTKCGKKCVDTDVSVKHCGACGNTCDSGDVCFNGECVTQICAPGQTQPCYTGPNGTENVGICHGGTRTCNAQGTGYGPCEGQVTPQTEICGNGQDDNCDGQVDEGCVPDPCENVTCTQLDQCHDVGVCDPQTGNCSNPPKQDNSPCNDGNACTQSDTCQNGVCVGAFPVVCSPLSECHLSGTCNPGTGQCSNPQKPNGSVCSVGTCQNGICTPA